MSDVVIRESLPWLIRAIGGRWRDGKRSYRMHWGELTVGKRGSAIDLCMFSGDDSGGAFSLHLHLFWISAFIRLPFLNRWAYEPGEMMVSWGYSLTPDMGLHLHWGERKNKNWPHRQGRMLAPVLPDIMPETPTNTSIS